MSKSEIIRGLMMEKTPNLWYPIFIWKKRAFAGRYTFSPERVYCPLFTQRRQEDAGTTSEIETAGG